MGASSHTLEHTVGTVIVVGCVVGTLIWAGVVTALVLERRHTQRRNRRYAELRGIAHRA